MAKNMRRSRPGREPRRCAFCGGGNISREHFWPEWAAPFLPNSPELTYQDSAQRLVGGLKAPQRTYRRTGPVITRKVKTVCKLCNNGWMNRLETTARPILTALATDKPATLSRDDQLALARWVAMKVMASEGDHRGDEVTFTHERRHFMATKDIPSGFSVWIAQCGHPDWLSTYVRHAFHMTTNAGDPTAHFGAGRKNIQQITFGFGHLFVTCVVIRVPGFGLDLTFPPASAAYLWPTTNETLTWPPPRRIGEIDALVVRDTMHRAVSSGPIVLRRPVR